MTSQFLHLHNVLDTTGESNIYFPFVENTPFNIEIVVTEFWYDFTHHGLFGYIINNETNPLYSVILGIQTEYVCTDPGYPCDPYTKIYYVLPALDVTLPNQPNPFYFKVLCYRSCEYIEKIFVASANRVEPSGENYYPLTVVNWDYIPIDENSGRLSGIIRNDSKKTLHNMQLVVFGPCAWRYAQIASSTLKPGRRTSFELAGSEDCLGNEILISGQGTIIT